MFGKLFFKSDDIINLREGRRQDGRGKDIIKKKKTRRCSREEKIFIYEMERSS